MILLCKFYKRGLNNKRDEINEMRLVKNGVYSQKKEKKNEKTQKNGYKIKKYQNSM